MSAHPDLRPLWHDEPPSGERRVELLAHLRDCGRCRSELAAREPSLLFSLLSFEPVPETVLQSVSRRVEAATSLESSRRRAVAGWPLRALAASLLVAGVFGAYLLRQPVPEAPTSAAVVPAAVVPAAIPAGMIEVITSPGDADVFEMSLGDVEVVMIFDEALKI